MSRCFPFPPPGYERKHRSEDLALLKEETKKEKQPKKEKKDKERRKDKEKREKDGSAKQRDKKDRKGKHKDKKEKHRDKKKDKEDRGKDKEKSSISEESTVAGKLEERSGEKLHPKGHSRDSSVEDEGKCSTFFQGQNGGKPFQSILPSQPTKEARFVRELDRRIRDDKKGRGSQFPERVASVDKRDQEAAAGTAVRNPSRVLAEEKNNDGEKRVDIKKLELQGLVGEFTGKAMVQNLTRVAKSKNEGIPRPEEEQNDWRLEDKEKYKETGDDKRGDKQKDRDKNLTGKSGQEFTGKSGQEFTRVAKSKNEGIPRPEEEQNDWRLEDKEKYKETGDDKRGDKQKDRDKKSHGKDKDKESHGKDKDKESHGKDKDKEKEKKKEEKTKVKIKNKQSKHEKSKNAGRNDLVGATSNKSANLLNDVDSAALNEGNIRKRKDMDTNGFLHESEIRPNKDQRLALHQSTENGRKFDASRISSNSSFDEHPVPNNVWLDHRDQLNNGIIEAQKPSPSKPNPCGTNMFNDQIVVAPKTPHPDFSNANEALTVPKMKDHIAADAPRRPPHPDSKYLSQILTVPKVGHWSENDDQQWLFSKKGPPDKAKLELAGVKEELRVWSEAVHIESADVYALPYVIPY